MHLVQGEWINIQGKQLIKTGFDPFWKGVYSKRKEFGAANSFLLEYTPFQKGLFEQECKWKVTKVVSFLKNGRTSTKYIKSP